MKKFKQFLVEEFREKLKGMGIYKNPTSEEWKKIPADVRALVDTRGNLFVSSVVGFTSGGVHRDIINWMSDLDYITSGKRSKFITDYEGYDVKEIITLQRVGKSMAFKFGESSHITSEVLDEPEFKNVKGLLKKVRKNNPKVKFILKNIDE